jgi:heme/copper-type cytochrome/quinol oxidase subunit 2
MTLGPPFPDIISLPCPAYPSTLKIESACSSALLAVQPSFLHCHHPKTGSVSRYFLLLRFDIFMPVIVVVVVVVVVVVFIVKFHRSDLGYKYA